MNTKGLHDEDPLPLSKSGEDYVNDAMDASLIFGSGGRIELLEKRRKAWLRNQYELKQYIARLEKQVKDFNILLNN